MVGEGKKRIAMTKPLIMRNRSLKRSEQRSEDAEWGGTAVEKLKDYIALLDRFQ